MNWKRYNGGCGWALTADGLATEGDVQLLRTGGLPQTVTLLWQDFGDHYIQAATHFGVGVDVLVALTAIESACLHGSLHRDPHSIRLEPGYVDDVTTPSRVSVGLLQTLISTAKSMAYHVGVQPDAVNRQWLCDPGHSIQVGAAYVHYQQMVHNGDPVLAQAAYNAGSVRPSSKNKWHFATYLPDRTEQFVSFFNDFYAAMAAGTVVVPAVVPLTGKF